MTWWMALLTFINTWWIMLFLVFPFFIRPEDRQKPEHYAAAPEPLRWGKLVLVDTLLSLVFTGLLALLFNSGWFHIDTMT